ncbi:MAG TPA: PDZ domain-containing protein, partial [Clostridiales bacterium]|nr:PDZ domain-containing protein [Clostridiales bacterium]
MAVDIFRVIKGSSSEKKGLRAGDTLISINGHEINDVLDFSFYAAEKNPILVYRRDGKIKKVKIRKAEDEDLGLEFETYLMDKQHH